MLLKEAEQQVERLISFSDAVIAIAVTLLVLPLVDRVSDVHSLTFNELIRDRAQQFMVFIISFVVICRFWLIHHNIFRRLRAFDLTLFWLNSLWLMTIVIMPFSTELIGKAARSELGAGIYTGTLLATSIVGLGIQWWINRKPELQKRPQYVSLLPTLVIVVILMVALIIAVTLPHIGPLALLLLLVSGYLTKALRSKI